MLKPVISLYLELVHALRLVVRSPEPVDLKPAIAFQLQSLGLVKLIEQQAVPSWELIRQSLQPISLEQ